VVRYFGGNLLGTGGLIRAYRTATGNMLSHARIIDRYLEDHLQISFPFEQLNAVMKVLRNEHLVPLKPEYAAACSFQVRVRKTLSENLSARLSLIPGLILSPEKRSDESHCAK
jgi:putative IMPACT (imprinted ancient) family translation regulator